MNDDQLILPIVRDDLACYAMAMWPVLSWPHIINVIVDRLEAVERGEIPRLMIFFRRDTARVCSHSDFSGLVSGTPSRSGDYLRDLRPRFERPLRTPCP